MPLMIVAMYSWQSQPFSIKRLPGAINARELEGQHKVMALTEQNTCMQLSVFDDKYLKRPYNEKCLNRMLSHIIHGSTGPSLAH